MDFILVGKLNSEYQSALVAAIGLLFVGAIISGWSIGFQRRIYQKIRTNWLSHLIKVEAFDPAALEKEWRTQARLSLIVYITVVVYLFLEGQFIQSIIAGVFAVAIFFLTQEDSESRTLVNLIQRVFIGLHIVEMLLIDESKVDFTLRRVAPRLCFIELLAIESLGETFFVTLAHSIVVSARGSNYAMPIHFFCLTVIPMHITGAREIACMQSVPKFLTRLDELSATALPIPILAMLFAYVNGSINKGDSVNESSYVIAFMHLVLCAACTFFGEMVDNTLTPIYNAFLKESYDASRMEESSILVDQAMIFSSCAIYLSGIYRAFAFVNMTTHFNRLIVCGITSTAMLSCYYRYESTGDSLTKRTAACGVHFCALLFILFASPECESHVVALATARVLRTIEKRRFSLVQRENAFCTALTLLWTNSQTTKFIIMFISLTTIVLGTIGCLSREIASRILAQEKDLQTFMHHRMGQKFSSIGSALEQLLDVLATSTFGVLNILPESHYLLRKALRECKRGNDQCSAINICLALISDEFRLNLEPKDLATMVNEWHEVGSLEVKQIRFVGKPPKDLDLDWELLRVTLNTWIREADMLIVEWFGSTENRSTFAVTFRLSGRRHLGFASFIMAQILNAKFSRDRSELVVFATITKDECPATKDEQQHDSADAISESPPSTMGSLTPLTTTRELNMTSDNNEYLTVLPANLVYAVLDDNALARRTIEKVVARQLKGSKESFSCGTSIADCQNFPRALIVRKVDVAIFDESLDYESEQGSISGTALAVVARQMGFNGCAILHSAHAHLSKTRPDVFDGFIVKSASQKAFILGVESAWKKHKAT